MNRVTIFAAAAALTFSWAAAGRAALAEAPTAPAPQAADIVRSATDLPLPIARRAPAVVKVNLETREVVGQLGEGATYMYWTFNGKVPGPLLRVRVGDTVEVTLHNLADNTMTHDVDLHAVSGPGGGGGATSAEPGQTKTFSFKALKPGLYVYHCATPMAAAHIANGMYGAILVEPENGLPKVDHEFYVMQGEVYTDEPTGSTGQLTMSVEKLRNEQPEYYVMNGAFKALTGPRAMHAKVGETVRIYFGDGGPNKTSSFHVIGAIFDHVYALGSLTTPPANDVQTITVPPGGAAIAELTLRAPGMYYLVDHALSRVDRGAAAVIEVSGAEDPAIFKAPPGTIDHGH